MAGLWGNNDKQPPHHASETPGERRARERRERKDRERRDRAEIEAARAAALQQMKEQPKRNKGSLG